MEISIALFSEDPTLPPVLASALGTDFVIRHESTEAGMKRLLAGDGCDTILLDLQSKPEDEKQRILFARRMISSQIDTIIMADDRMRSTAAELVRQGAYGYCRNPPSVRDLKTMLLRAYQQSGGRTPAPAQRVEESDRCDKLIGSSPAMRRVYELIRCVANNNASVLVTGDSGTGKELIASAIHTLGNRSGKPFVAVSCGAIPETLIESELFGHDKGAFTGTVGTRVGLLEEAGEGTLFLDEIGEISLATQVKLLRVLQQREFTRLGSNRPIPLRARLIFATHQNLEELVERGRFRQDLYYRVNVMHIEAPALQDHPEDIPLIAMHFLRIYSEMYDKRVVNIEPHAMALLQSYGWPGNVRELENVIQRALIICSEASIGATDLPQAIQNESPAISDEEGLEDSFEGQLRDYKVRLALNAVRENNGNKTLAAKSLHISRAYLHRLIRGEDSGLVVVSDSSFVESA